ncbi:hypothetical protein GCK32_010007 [Trichostrongylus colubriformis]|uniref:Uncharacterized protein n=1 Tax=Trichostrongylus colubriformis TaxID=6319 RepID=A0AAN8IE43_TRICO
MFVATGKTSACIAMALCCETVPDIGIADVISILSNCLLRLNRELDLGEEYRRMVMVVLVSSGTAYIAHMIGNMFIAINRYSAICFIHQYDKIWVRKNVWIIVLVQYVVALSACIHFIGSDLVYIRKPDGTSTYKGLEKQTDMFYANRIDGVRNTSIKSLLMYTVIVFISTMLICSLQITVGIAVFIGNDRMFISVLVQIFWANYIMVSIPPFSLLLLSSDLRSEVLELFCIKKLKNNVTTTVSVF